MDLRQLRQGLAAFAVLDPTHLSVHFVQVFLLVAENERLTFREIEKTLNLSNSAVSRIVMAMGDTNRKGKPGFDLLEVVRDPSENRRFLVQLTSKGQAYKRQLEGI